MKRQYFFYKKAHQSYSLFRQQQGSTLVEVIVAIFVLSFGVLALMLAQLAAVNTSINAANQAEVTRAVQNYIEVMRAQPKIAAKAYENKNGNRISVLLYDYSNHNIPDTDQCIAKLGLNVVSATVKKCIIENGQITVNWSGQQTNSDDSNDNDFTYSLSVHKGQPQNSSD